tara:strand:- start:90 stop:383 length:294 start_codon:yes stop_codon:yes gene_type:complete
MYKIEAKLHEQKLKRLVNVVAVPMEGAVVLYHARAAGSQLRRQEGQRMVSLDRYKMRFPVLASFGGTCARDKAAATSNSCKHRASLALELATAHKNA